MAAPPTDSLYTLMWQVTAYAGLLGDAALAGTPLTHASSSMLLSVLDEPGLTVAEMSRRIPKTQQALSQVVARLEKLGLVERRLGTGRGVGLHVTDAGRDLAHVARERERELARQLHDLLGDKRTVTLRKALGESRTILRDAR